MAASQLIKEFDGVGTVVKGKNFMDHLVRKLSKMKPLF